MSTVFSNDDTPRARLLVEFPANRYRLLSAEGRTPQIGDVVVLDQEFTGADGDLAPV